MEKLGLSRRADLDYDDPKYPPEDNPTIVYAITRDEWLAAQAWRRVGMIDVFAIQTERLVLRPWREADHGALLAIASTPRHAVSRRAAQTEAEVDAAIGRLRSARPTMAIVSGQWSAA